MRVPILVLLVLLSRTAWTNLGGVSEVLYETCHVPPSQILQRNGSEARSLIECASLYYSRGHESSNSFFQFERENRSCFVGSVDDAFTVRRSRQPGSVEIMARPGILLPSE